MRVWEKRIWKRDDLKKKGLKRIKWVVEFEGNKGFEGNENERSREERVERWRN